MLIDHNIIEFLVKAKKATYAGKGAETNSSRIHSHDLKYSEGDFLYYDTYLGSLKFAGEEALWKNNAPFWSLNYCGRVLGEGFSGDFLKEALFNVDEGYPYRGPKEYINGELTYICNFSGDFDWFHGVEEIYKDGLKVYECMFHGGCISES